MRVKSISRLLRKLFHRRSPDPDWQTANVRRIARLRDRGVRIGEGCVVLTEEFSTEPYLVELGDHVAVASGTIFLTHDGSVRLLRHLRPNLQHFGRIVVGHDTFIGQNSILLPGTHIGARCLIGAGSVVRGRFPDDSLVIGNPARNMGPTILITESLLHSPDSFDSLELSPTDRRIKLEAHFGIPPVPKPDINPPA